VLIHTHPVPHASASRESCSVIRERHTPGVAAASPGRPSMARSCLARTTFAALLGSPPWRGSIAAHPPSGRAPVACLTSARVFSPFPSCWTMPRFELDREDPPAV
jgi:hypothetical protein